jgi:hypothetical protein
VRRAATALLLLLGACAPPRKVLLFCREIPTPATLRAHVSELERAPFDGLVLDVPVAGRERTLAWLVWGREAVAASALEGAERDLGATRFRRFTHNFLRVNAMPGDVDWFDEEWRSVAANAGVAAAFARRTGLRGLVLDTEQYGEARPFDYAARRHAERAFGDYAEQARRRGRELIASINAAYPDVTLLVLFGHTLPFRRVGGPDAHPQRVPDAALARVEYGLVAPFLDGVIEAASPQTLYVDAYESSYPYRERAQFSRARGLIRDGAARASRVPHLYRRRVRAGFGLWLDFESDRRGWHAADPSKNFFSPDGFGQVLRAALAETDGYVWVYSEKPDWLSGRDLPAGYLAALRAARY